MTSQDMYRLPRNVLPERYELTLTPDLDSATFAGEERIRVHVLEPTRRIQLNAADLRILDVTLTADDGRQFEPAHLLSGESERLVLDFETEVTTGPYTLQITFAGELNDKLRGFYRSRYVDDSGTSHTIATTQFEATEARRAFPCWDEPDIKAVFAVTLIVDEALAAFSNSRVVEETPLANGKRQVGFADTIVMSTYILVFIVGPLVVARTEDVDGTELRVICVPGREALTPFAIESGAAALRYFSEYFAIAYPSDKLDLVAIPDFAAGAMENFGCATFRETALLVDLERGSQQQIERVAEVVGHEIAHMWFGDLVTMKWWNGLWLNEAFANFMESMFVDRFRPDWDRWTNVGVGTAGAMSVDSLHSTRAVEFEVRAPAEAEEMFDVLTYWKGGAVLRMLEQHLGPEVFRSGVQRYLSAHAYGNAETTDLWDALDAVSEEPVRVLMDSWIFQAGHPLVEAARVDGTTIRITQRRALFLDDGTDETSWNVPVSLRSRSGDDVFDHRFLLSGSSTDVTLPSPPDSVVVNTGFTGFYPVGYSPDLLSSLTADLSHMSALERFNLVNSTWNACLSGRSELRDVMSMLESFSEEDDPNVWRVLLAPVRVVDHLVDDNGLVQDFVRHMTEARFERLGWERRRDETTKEGNLRALIIGARGTLGADDRVRDEAARRFAEYRATGKNLDAELVTPAQAVLASTNEARHYETLRSRATDATLSPQEQTAALQSLAGFTDEGLVTRTLDMMMSDDIRSQDAPYVIASMLTRKQSGDRIWEWIESNWQRALDRFPNNSIDRMIGGIASRYDIALLERADTFLASHPVPGAAAQIEQTRELMRVNKAFHARYSTRVDEVLRR